MVKILLEHGKVGLRGCISKKGNKFTAYFYYEKDPKDKKGRYRWRLEFLDDRPGPAETGPGSEENAPPAGTSTDQTSL